MVLLHSTSIYKWQQCYSRDAKHSMFHVCQKELCGKQALYTITNRKIKCSQCISTFVPPNQTLIMETGQLIKTGVSNRNAKTQYGSDGDVWPPVANLMSQCIRENAACSSSLPLLEKKPASPIAKQPPKKVVAEKKF